jgi:glucose dehydrogenase
MTDIVITAANVVASGSAQVDRSGVAGAVLTAGQVVYKEAATGLIKLVDTDSATVEAKSAYGITLNGAAVGQPVAVAVGGPVTIGGTLTAGVAYYASNTAGGICPVADLATEHVVFLGLAASTSVLNLRIINSGVTIA